MTTCAAEQLATEADRGRAALLAAVSHDLRAPLAAAKAAVSGLRARDARLVVSRGLAEFGVRRIRAA
jgi:K+-sensing histidine kinase KdpD